MKKIHKKVMALLLAALMITSVMDTHVQAESSTEANNISVVNDGTGDEEEVSDVEGKDKKENADRNLPGIQSIMHRVFPESMIRSLCR